VQEVRLGSRLGGRVAAVHVREGQVAEPGQLLVTIEQPEWSAKREQARQRVAAAQAALEKANNGPLEEEIAEAKAAADAAKARLARATAGFREEEKRQAKADLAAAQAEQERADKEYARLAQLPQQVAVSKEELDAAAAARDSARARVRSARARLDLVLAGTRPEEVAEAKAEAERWTARYELLRRGTRGEDKAAAYAAVKQAEAELAEADVNFHETTVAAPERCVIEVLVVRPGDLVPPGQPVVRALRADDLWVKVFAPATELGRLRLGQAVAVAVDSHPGRRFAGEITQIANVSEFTPRNVQSLDERRHQVFAVKVRVADPEGVFKSGMAAEVFVPMSD
jgi:multidrug resistance efflux pump